MSAFCGAMFDTDDGTGVCEHIGSIDAEPHIHGGVVTVGLFRCHSCRRRIGEVEWPDEACRCPSGDTTGGDE